MSKFRKFTIKGMNKAIENEIAKMSNEEAYEMAMNVGKLYNIIAKYDEDKIGSSKRIEDLYGYAMILAKCYNKRFKVKY